MQSKRILLSLLTVLLICFLAGTATVSAAGAAPSLDLTVDISCSDAVTADPVLVVQPGDTLTVSVAVEGNPGFWSLQFNLSYNSDLLELVKDGDKVVHTLNKDVFGNAQLNSHYNLHEPEETPGTIEFVYVPFGRADVISKNDTELFELSFKVKEGAHGDLDIGLHNVLACDVLFEEIESITTAGDVACVHTYSNAPVDKDATCITPGTKTYTCADCGEDLVLEMSTAFGHSLTYLPLTLPNCEETGNIAYYFCSTCEKCFLDEQANVQIPFENTIIPANGHTLKKIAKVEPTCEDTGVVEYWDCAVCGKNFADENAAEELTDEQLIIPANGHTLKKIAKVEPTCEDTGVIEYWTCTVCGKNFADENAAEELTDEQLIIPANGHELVKVPAVAATCEDEGNIEYWDCTVCGKNFADENAAEELTDDELIIPANGHELVKVPAVSPTCEETGNLAYWDCTVCGKNFSGEDAATEWSDENVTLPAKGHNLVPVGEVKPTCVDVGYITYWECSACGKFFADEEGTAELTAEQLVVSATGHFVTFVPAVAPTCEDDGNIGYWVCSACGCFFADEKATEELTAEELVDPAKGHTLVKVPAVAPTCEETGVIEYWDCTVCGKNFADENATEELTDEQLIIPANGHTLVKVPKVEPTCEETGVIEYWDCTVCGKNFADENAAEELTDDELIIPANGHTLVKVPKVEPTCEETGVIEYWDCTVCGKNFADENAAEELTDDELIIPANGHTLVNVPAIAPTCEETGVIEYWDCTVCGKNFADENATEELTDDELIVPANGHTLVKVPAVAPTCEETGVIEYWDCSVCGKNFNDDKATTELADADLIIEAAGHNWVVDEAVEPTYSADGKTEGKHCDVCGEVLIPQDIIPQKSLAWLWILIAVVVVAAAGVLSYFFIFKKKVKRY